MSHVFCIISAFLLFITVRSFAADSSASVDERIDRSAKEKKIPWQEFPDLKVMKIDTAASTMTLKAKNGESLVAVFIASWCIPCQNLIEDIKKMQKKHNNAFTNFVYIFTHDTRDDAHGFAMVHQLKEAYLATPDLLKSFHQPPLPSIYVSDRQSWMVMRRLEVNEKGLEDIDRFLDLHNSM